MKWQWKQLRCDLSCSTRQTRLHRCKRQIVSGWLDITLVAPRYALIAIGKGMDKVGRCCAGVSITDSHIFNIGLIIVVVGPFENRWQPLSVLAGTEVDCLISNLTDLHFYSSW